MSRLYSTSSLLRPRGEGVRARVTNLELFFDLVFVYAITQLSHLVLADVSLDNTLRAGLLFLAVWWVWIYTSWVTNWLDPDRVPVRLALFVMMLLGLLIAITIPKAFGEKGFVFGLAYAAFQVGRTAFALYAFRNNARNTWMNFVRILIWMVISAVFWIFGGVMEGEARVKLWCVALGLELLAPILYFYVPGLGRSSTDDWHVDGGHMAERCSLFIIIALGESLLVTGATFEKLVWTPLTITTAMIALISSVAMWWIYFDTGAERGAEHIAHTSDPGRMARYAYTYLHIPIVAGVIIGAVADELVLLHPRGHASLATITMIVGGPVLYILGNGLFKFSFSKYFPLSHLVGLGLLALMVPFISRLEPITLYALVTAVLVQVAAWETISWSRNKVIQE